MTCIVGYVEKDNVWIGGDSQTTGSVKKELSKLNYKVFKKQDILFGVSGLHRHSQLLQHVLEIPTRITNCTDFEYLCRQLVPAIIKCLKNNNALEAYTPSPVTKATSFIQQFINVFDQHNKAKADLNLLLGYKNNLYSIDCVFAITSIAENYNAVGSGSSVALGVLHCLEDVGMPTRERLTRALKAAARFAIGVRGPFVIKSLNGEE